MPKMCTIRKQGKKPWGVAGSNLRENLKAPQIESWQLAIGPDELQDRGSWEQGQNGDIKHPRWPLGLSVFMSMGNEPPRLRHILHSKSGQ